MWALVVNIFDPLITQSSPSRTARVCAFATSEPASGSVNPRTQIVSARRTLGTMSRRISSVPNRTSALATISDTDVAYIGASCRLSSSKITICDVGSRPAPPSSFDQADAYQPWSMRPWMNGRSWLTPVR